MPESNKNFLDHVQRHIRAGGLEQVSALALVEKLQSRSDREKEKAKSGLGHTWPALKNMRINREAAAAADRVRKRLRSEVLYFGSSGLHGNIQTLVSWGRDLIFFNTDIRDPRVSWLVTAAWAPKIRSLGIKITPQSGDKAEPDALVKALRHLPNLREV
ncbi:hypothetical protein INS49_009460 [Diaporthe citri]|uniref:uncharacterized protein n=1 Tax=Diaporthe citri TaxID=83186 RepID=UPI001C7F06DF|nr:uncharacterized protein INS49_009460 [Diaporthe citri]KAG6361236.1 hypothetical protein INS49_009460 [Diaporthe citri]